MCNYNLFTAFDATLLGMFLQLNSERSPKFGSMQPIGLRRRSSRESQNASAQSKSHILCSPCRGSSCSCAKHTKHKTQETGLRCRAQSLANNNQTSANEGPNVQSCSFKSWQQNLIVNPLGVDSPPPSRVKLLWRFPCRKRVFTGTSGLRGKCKQPCVCVCAPTAGARVSGSHLPTAFS